MIKILLSKFKKLILILISLLAFISCSEIDKINKTILERNPERNIYFGIIDTLQPFIVSGIEFKKDKFNSNRKKSYELELNQIFEVGQNVIINYKKNIDDFEVVKIQSDNLLLGPVSYVGETELIILSQKVIISDYLLRGYSKIIPGHWIEVSGFYEQEGKILATNIKLKPSQSFGYIKGKVSQLDKNIISIGKQVFKFRTPITSTVSGDIVKIVFTLDDDLYKTFKIENLSNKYINLLDYNIIIDGFVFQGDDKKYRISGFPFIIYDSDQLFEGQRVKIKGKIIAGSIIDNK